MDRATGATRLRVTRGGRTAWLKEDIPGVIWEEERRFICKVEVEERRLFCLAEEVEERRCRWEVEVEECRCRWEVEAGTEPTSTGSKTRSTSPIKAGDSMALLQCLSGRTSMIATFPPFSSRAGAVSVMGLEP